MKKIKNYSILNLLIVCSLIILFLFASTSCKRDQQGITQQELDRMLKELYSGKGGLELKFVPNAPPNEVLPDQEIQLIFYLENTGAFNITEGYFGVGFEKDYLFFKNGTFDGQQIPQNELLKFSLRGRTIYEKKGEQETAILKFYSKPLENLSLYHDVKFRISACYDYSTYLVADICVNLDQPEFATKPVKGVCKFQPLTYSGQGAPVGISLIDVKILPWDDTYRPEFYIEISNYADGIVLNKNDIKKACSNEPINRSTLNVVYFNGTFMGKPLICSPQAVILKDNIGKTRCWTERFDKEELASKRSFLSPLVIKFDYGYMQTWSKSTRITKIPI